MINRVGSQDVYFIDYMLTVIPLICFSFALMVLTIRIMDRKSMSWKTAIGISGFLIVVGAGSFLIAAKMVQSM